jgi:hypothetical protein
VAYRANPLTTALVQPQATAPLQGCRGWGRVIKRAWAHPITGNIQSTPEAKHVDQQHEDGLDPGLSHGHPQERHTGEPFAMAWVAALLPVVALVSEKRLGSEDLLTLAALAGLMEYPTGRIEISAVELAAVMKRHPGRVRHSLARLRREDLIARMTIPRERRRRCYLINPALVSMGGASRRGYTFQVFNADRHRAAAGKAVSTATTSTPASDSGQGRSVGAQ